MNEGRRNQYIINDKDSFKLSPFPKLNFTQKPPSYRTWVLTESAQNIVDQLLAIRCFLAFSIQFYQVQQRYIKMILRIILQKVQQSSWQIWLIINSMNNHIQGLAFLLKQAISPQSNAREQAMTQLQQISNNDDQFFKNITSLLAYNDYNIHILAYSYIKNQIIRKLRRVISFLAKPLYEVFLFLEQSKINAGGHQQITLIQKMQKNTIQLAVSSYSKPSEQKQRNFWLASCLPVVHGLDNEQKQYYRLIIDGLVQQLPYQQLKTSNNIAVQFLPLIFELWEMGGVVNYQMAINLSRFLSIFPERVFLNLLRLLGQIHPSHNLFFRIIQRLAIALTLERYYPRYQIAFDLYRLIKSNLMLLKPSEIQIPHLLSTINIINACLKKLLWAQSPIRLQPHINIVNVLLSLPQYHDLIQWLISISSNETMEQDHSNQICKLSQDIIELYSDMMPPQQLTSYYNDLVRHLNGSDQKKLITFLSGLPHRTMEMFNCQAILENILQQSLERQTQITDVSYLLFIQKCVEKMYYMEPALLAKVQRCILLNLEWYQQQLFLPQNMTDKASRKLLLTKVAFLLSIQMTISKYPKNQNMVHKDQLSYINYISSLVFDCILKTCCFQFVQEKLFDNLLALVHKSNSIYSNTILSKAASTYNMLLTFQQAYSLEYESASSLTLTKTQMLTVIRESLSIQADLENQELTLNLKRVFLEFDPEDSVICLQMVYLYRKIMQIYNRKMIGLDKARREAELQTSKSFLNKGVFKAVQDMLFSEKPNEFALFINNNLEYDFTKNVTEFIKQYACALNLLLQLSIYRDFFQPVTIIALKFINYLQTNANNFQLLVNKARVNQFKLKSIFQLHRLPIYLDCLLEILYINPNWRKQPLSALGVKAQLISQPRFVKCKERIDSVVAGDLTKMLSQISLENRDEKKEQLELWDNAYSDFLQDSVVGKLCNYWIRELKQGQM